MKYSGKRKIQKEKFRKSINISVNVSLGRPLSLIKFIVGLPVYLFIGIIVRRFCCILYSRYVGAAVGQEHYPPEELFIFMYLFIF